MLAIVLKLKIQYYRPFFNLNDYVKGVVFVRPPFSVSGVSGLGPRCRMEASEILRPFITSDGASWAQ